MARSTLRGISDKHLKDTVGNLEKQGWSASWTDGGHLRLIHPDAAHPVFSSGTPSCHRAATALLSDCRRAIKAKPLQRVQAAGGAASAIALAAGGPPPSFDPSSLPGQGRKRKARWTPEERLGRREAPAPAAPAPVPEPVAEAPEAPAEPFSPPVSLDDLNVVPFPDMDMPQTPIAPTAEDAPEQTAIATPAVAAEPAPAPAPTPQPASRPASPQVQRAARTPATPATPAAPRVIDADLLDLALRIQKGEMQALEITPDMVGRTFWFSGEGVFTGTRPAAAPPAGRPATTPTGEADRNALLEALDAEEWVSFKTLMELLDVTARGRIETLRHRMRSLVASGEVDMLQDGRTNRYRRVS